jgi:hypothetical protein
MKRTNAPWITALSGVVLAVLVPLLAHWARRHSLAGCALDGLAIDPFYRVEILDHKGREHVFCCLRCATLWLDRQSDPPRVITVTDEVSGERIDAAKAWYVRSPVVTTLATGNNIHVFRNRAEAEKNALEHLGTVLSETENPFP